MVSPTDPPITARAVEDFTSTAFDDPSQANDFFHNHSCGNTPEVSNLPYERFKHYEDLLSGMRRLDPIKYSRMHKGTPLFFLAWLAFDLRNFEKALYFLDAAISEDILRANDRTDLSVDQRTQGWINLPGAQFIKLMRGTVADRTVKKLREVLEGEFRRFSEASGQQSISTDEWVEKVVEPLLIGQSGRTLLCAFYVFLYEYRDRLKEIQLRTGAQSGGANHPLLNHLFLGGLVFESLLKRFYDRATTLDQIFNDNPHRRAFRADFGITEERSLNVGIRNLSTIEGIASTSGMVAAFETTAQLRNATGHNLERDNIFDQPALYTALFSQVMAAILYVVSVKFIRA